MSAGERYSMRRAEGGEGDGISGDRNGIEEEDVWESRERRLRNGEVGGCDDGACVEE